MSDPSSSAADQVPTSLGLRRPDVQSSWWDRQRQILQRRVETWRVRTTGRPVQPRNQFDPAEIDVAPDSAAGLGDDRGGFFTALIAVGAAMLALGSLWAWQSWSTRSSQPIDELLPVLSASGASPAPELPATPPVDSSDTALAPPEQTTAAKEETAQAEPVGQPTAGPLIIVHVSGAVVAPGVVELGAGSRVFEAITRAGGADTLADLNRVNLAAPLTDGERIHIPRIGEDELPVVVQPQRPTNPSAPHDGSSLELALVDINVADVQELQQLPGVGPSLAQAIVRTRDARGPFLLVDELLEVPGIGDAKLAALAPQALVVVPAR